MSIHNYIAIIITTIVLVIVASVVPTPGVIITVRKMLASQSAMTEISHQ